MRLAHIFLGLGIIAAICWASDSLNAQTVTNPDIPAETEFTITADRDAQSADTATTVTDSQVLNHRTPQPGQAGTTAEIGAIATDTRDSSLGQSGTIAFFVAVGLLVLLLFIWWVTRKKSSVSAVGRS
ncbi:MAG: hypothetical protein ACOYUK_05830 [Patescibacteria group bacterium]